MALLLLLLLGNVPLSLCVTLFFLFLFISVFFSLSVPFFFLFFYFSFNTNPTSTPLSLSVSLSRFFSQHFRSQLFFFYSAAMFKMFRINNSFSSFYLCSFCCHFLMSTERKQHICFSLYTNIPFIYIIPHCT